MRLRTLLPVFLSVVFLASCGGGDEADRQAAALPLTPKVLLIGLDGVRPDILAEVPTPNIDALAAAGAFTDHARTGLPSVSGPGWSSMLNGVWPDKHGVTNNDFTGKRYDLYPDFLTRIEQVRPELGTFAVADWKPLVWAEDGMATISDVLDEKHVLDGYETGWSEGDEESAALAVAALADPGMDALFVYLGNPDEVSHETHSIGDEYRHAIALADSLVGVLVAAVRGRPTYTEENWLILMSTDHGRTADGDHGGDTPEERTIFFLASGPSAMVGTPADTVFIVDIPVTALAHLGVPADPSWSLDGKVVGLKESR